MTPAPDITFLPYTPDALDQVRQLHATSFEVLARHAHSPEQVAAHTRFTQSDDYAQDLLRSHVLMACFHGQVVATSGWIDFLEQPATARLRKVFVHPDMAGAGLGRRMVRAAEDAARDAGLRKFHVRANINARGFYERMGYLPHKMGIMPACGVELPVLFMKKG